jgi:flavin reductase (DIM6/NTAB) family NADH-FMN oxidoreductase RutF
VSTELDVAKLSVGDAYKLLIGTIVPRPIAWVSTIGKSGVTNLAPFSFFNGVCSNPPSLLFCPVNHPDGREKDTLRNIREIKQFVVNIASEPLAKAVNQSSADYPSNVSEFAEAGVTPVPSTRVAPPRVKESPASFECELLELIKVGPGGAGSGHVVIGKIVYAHFAKGVYEAGKISIAALQPIARLGGPNYCPVRDVFELQRPRLENPMATASAASTSKRKE